MTIDVLLKNNTLLIVISTPTGRDIHLEVSDNPKATRLHWIIRQKSDVAILGIRASNGSHAKQVGIHLGGRGSSILVFTIVPILNNHNTERNWRGTLWSRRYLLKVEAKVKILHLNLLADDIV